MERTAATCVLHSFERYEKKYILTEAQYEAILPEIKKHTVMDVYGQYTICNIYYDTEHYDLIRQSLRKPYYKEKFRVRSYGVPGAGTNIFAEIKKKSGDIVYKRRVDGTPDEIGAFLDESAPLSANRQIQDEILWFMKKNRPSPKVFIGYDRTAYAGIEDPEFRITFDRNIRYRLHDLDLRSGDHGDPVTDDGTVIMEVKIKDAMPLWLVPILSRNRLYPGSFSKYGACYERFIAREAFSPSALRQILEAKEAVVIKGTEKADKTEEVINTEKVADTEEIKRTEEVKAVRKSKKTGERRKSCSAALLGVLSPSLHFSSVLPSRWHSAS